MKLIQNVFSSSYRQSRSGAIHTIGQIYFFYLDIWTFYIFDLKLSQVEDLTSYIEKVASKLFRLFNSFKSYYKLCDFWKC